MYLSQRMAVPKDKIAEIQILVASCAVVQMYSQTRQAKYV